MKQKFFSKLEVSEITGLTLRQLQWWDETDVLNAGKSECGRYRRYSAEQVATVLVFANLKHRGLKLSKIRIISDRVRGAALRREILLTDGRTVKFTDSQTEAFEIAKSSNSLLFVDLAEVTLGMGR